MDFEGAEVPQGASARHQAAGDAYARGMERLLAAVEELSLARALVDVQRIVGTAARELVGCDGATFVLSDGDHCYYADEDAITPLWMGRRFPQETCISGWVMRHRTPAIVPDIYADDRIPHDAYRPTFVKSLAIVPIRASSPVGAIGSYWAQRHEATASELRLLQALANAASVAMENVRVYSELEARVRQRTADLVDSNREIQKLSVTDELTGLYNRRGFYEAAKQALGGASRVFLMFADVDGMKRINDEFGHAAGDVVLREMAATLRASFRQADVVGRVGGDEFCVLVADPAEDAGALRSAFLERLDRANATRRSSATLSASLGIAEGVAGDDLDRLVADADRRMYAEKNARRAARAPTAD